MKPAYSTSYRGTEALKRFEAQFPRLASLKGNFAESVYSQLATKGKLSDRQMDALQRMADTIRNKIEENKQNEVSKQDSPKIDPAVFTLGEKAKDGGKFVIRLDGFRLKNAPLTGRNPGAVYAQSNTGDYLGMFKDGAFRSSRNPVPDNFWEQVAEVKSAAIKYGHKTGICSCCGRTLTNKESIEAGIGPVCASKI